ncbi:MAG: NAD(+)/NADH kinase [Thermoproteota archaeon]
MAEPIAIYARTDREYALRLAREVFSRLKELGAEPLYDVSVARHLDGPSVDLSSEDSDVRKVVVVGGDGTVLRLLQLLGDRTPILHLVRAGRKAFLFDETADEALAHLEEFVAGNFHVEKVMRLLVETKWSRLYALNEAAILALGAKTVDLRVEVEDDTVYERLEGDGVIIATPTGSTAYSYSCGGPVLHPTMDAYVITPVNAVDRIHSPVVVPGSMRARVTVSRSPRPVKLVVDGSYEAVLSEGEVVVAVLRAPSVNIARYKPVRLRAPWRMRPAMF